MISRNPGLLLAAALVLTAPGCATNRPTLLEDWPPHLTSHKPGPYYGQGVPHGSAAAARWFQVEAERGVPEAQFNLGVMYSRGEGVEQNFKEALRWLRRAESHGIRQAEAQLGSLYAQGEVATADPDEAARWLEAAADAGNSEALAMLGTTYASVAPPSPVRAPAETREVAAVASAPNAAVAAAQQERLGRGSRSPQERLGRGSRSPQEQLALADRYRSGDGVRKDPAHAARLYEGLADNGLPAAQQRLGHAYREGVGVPRDYVLAYQWLSLATAAGDETARTELDEVEGKLSTEHVLEAQALAREWYELQSTRGR